MKKVAGTLQVFISGNHNLSEGQCVPGIGIDYWELLKKTGYRSTHQEISSERIRVLMAGQLR
jgi:hypothetical protein